MTVTALQPSPGRNGREKGGSLCLYIGQYTRLTKEGDDGLERGRSSGHPACRRMGPGGVRSRAAAFLVRGISVGGSVDGL